MYEHRRPAKAAACMSQRTSIQVMSHTSRWQARIDSAWRACTPQPVGVKIRVSACETEVQRRDKDTLSDRPAAPEWRERALGAALRCVMLSWLHNRDILATPYRDAARRGGRRCWSTARGQRAAGTRWAGCCVAWLHRPAPGWTPFCGPSRRNAAWGRAEGASQIAERTAPSTGVGAQHHVGAQPQPAVARPPTALAERSLGDAQRVRVSCRWDAARMQRRGGRRGSAAECIGGAWRASLCAVSR